MRISAAMLSESEQQSFTYTAVKKAIEIVIREGVAEQNAAAGLQTFTETFLNQENPDNDQEH